MPKRRVGGGVVLHVEGDRGAGVAGRVADGAGVLERHLLADVGQRLADRGELHRDLGVAGQALRGQRVEEVEVGRDGGVGLLAVEGVLAQEVQRHVQPGLDERVGRLDGVVGGLTGHVARDDAARHRHGGDEALDLVAAGEHEQGLPEHGSPPGVDGGCDGAAEARLRGGRLLPCPGPVPRAGGERPAPRLVRAAVRRPGRSPAHAPRPPGAAALASAGRAPRRPERCPAPAATSGPPGCCSASTRSRHAGRTVLPSG